MQEDVGVRVHSTVQQGEPSSESPREEALTHPCRQPSKVHVCSQEPSAS